MYWSEFERLNKLRNEVVCATAYVFIAMPRAIIKAYSENKDQNISLKRVLAFKKILGFMNIMVSSDVLQKVKKNLQEYKDHVFRVVGYSALFVALDPIVQEDIIRWMEYTMQMELA